MKNRRKQFIFLGFILLLIVSLSACSHKRSAEEILTSSIKKSAKTMDCDIEGNLKYTVESETSSSSDVNFVMAFRSKISDFSSKSMKMEMDSKISVFQQLIHVNSYYTDGYYYNNTDDEKQKTKMDPKQIQKQVKSAVGQTQIPARYYKDLKLKEKDGRQVLSYSLTKKGLNEYVNVIMSQLGSLTGNTSDKNLASSMEIASFSGVKTLNSSDLPVKETTKLVLKNKDGQPGKIRISMTVVYKNPGKSVKVSLPSDLASYKEVSNIEE